MNHCCGRASGLSASRNLYQSWLDPSLQVKGLGYSHGGYKQTLHSIRDAIVDRLSLPERAFLAIKSPSLRVIDHGYALLRVLGEPSTKLARK